MRLRYIFLRKDTNLFKIEIILKLESLIIFYNHVVFKMMLIYGGANLNYFGSFKLPTFFVIMQIIFMESFSVRMYLI